MTFPMCIWCRKPCVAYESVNGRALCLVCAMLSDGSLSESLQPFPGELCCGQPRYASMSPGPGIVAIEVCSVCGKAAVQVEKPADFITLTVQLDGTPIA